MADYDSSQHVTAPDLTNPQHVDAAPDFDFRPKPGSPAVDAGTVLPNINDGAAGRAPDVGAIELGQPVPQDGPR